jgi:hypothetical protein
MDKSEWSLATKTALLVVVFAFVAVVVVAIVVQILLH